MAVQIAGVTRAAWPRSAAINRPAPVDLIPSSATVARGWALFSDPYPIPVSTPLDRNKLDEMQGEIRALRETAADLQRRLEKQAVLVRALFALLSAKQGLTEAELLDQFRRLEKERAGTPPKKCSQCGRAVNQRTRRCLYCGAACEVESAFELLELGAWPNPAPHLTGSAVQPSREHGITSRPGK
jgi:hypothetical protein